MEPGGGLEELEELEEACRRLGGGLGGLEEAWRSKMLILYRFYDTN